MCHKVDTLGCNSIKGIVRRQWMRHGDALHRRQVSAPPDSHPHQQHDEDEGVRIHFAPLNYGYIIKASIYINKE